MYPKYLKQSTIYIFIICFFCCCKNKINENIVDTPNGMVWVEGKTFTQGAKDNDEFALQREKPAHEVKVDGFFIDETEVTNKQYTAFVSSTGYTTVAERAVTWDELKQSLPPDTPKPHDSILKPGCLVFNKSVVNGTVNNNLEWWTWKIGANWKHPDGPNSNIEGKDNYPVVHIALEDALAYCKWANRRLPTEAEWEAAAQGKNSNNIFTWGNNSGILNQNANTWQGVFPTENNSKDGYEFIAPVKSYPPNSIGIYDMLGNVWEITSDKFNTAYYEKIDASIVLENPKGSSEYFNQDNPYQKENVMKGGSFLCNDSYCASFRISAKMGISLDSGAAHIGFRTVATKEMLLMKTKL